MKRYEYALLTRYPWAAETAKPGVFYFGGGEHQQQGSQLLIMLNELGAQGWRVVIGVDIHSGEYLLERELPN